MELYIQQAKAGDEHAIQLLTTKHKPRLFAKAYSYVKNEQDAEDIVQETFIKAFRSLHQLKEHKYFATWLFKILIHESFRVLKKQERTKQMESEMIDQMLLIEQESNTDYSQLHRALASIKKDYQVALVLHYFYDFKVFEIAEMLEKPTNTIKMHLHRGRKALRIKLEQEMQQPLQNKDVKRMLKEQLFKLAQQYASAPAQYELEIEDYRDGIASFMWRGETKDEGIFIRLDEQGRLDDFAKTPTKEGPDIKEEEKQQMAENLMRQQYPEALKYFTLVEQLQKDSCTSFYYKQLVGGIPLDGYYCRIEITNPGEIINFTYTGFMENPPEMPEQLYDPTNILETLNQSGWAISAEYLNDKYHSVPETGIYPIYESELLTQAYDAVTGNPLFDYGDAPKRSYVPFPLVEALPKKDSIEEIIGISDEWERFEEASMDDQYEQLNWRPKDWQAPKNKTYEEYMKRKFENSVKAKMDPITKRLRSFIWFAEIEGDMQLSEEECLHIAAQFVQTYYPEFVPYLQVELKGEDDIEEKRAFFRFVIQKNGMNVENEFFHLSVSKKTGQITMSLAPDISIVEIEKFQPTEIKPIGEFLPLEGLKVQLEWDKVYGETEDEADSNRLIYRIRSTRSAFVKGVNAQTGEVIYSLI